MNSRNVYIGLTAVFVSSLLAVLVFFHYFPLSVVTTLAGIPAIVSLCGALFQLSRDSLAHQRALAMEEAKNRFTIGATSHMANIAFDKHVLFCEEYIAEMQLALACLYSKGPSRELIPHAQTISRVRQKWALWLTPQLEDQLQPYEKALYKIGFNEDTVARFPGLDMGQKLIDEMYLLCAEVIGEDKEWNGKTLEGNIATQKMIGKLRKVLGIDDLTQLRSELIDRASQSTKYSSL